MTKDALKAWIMAFLYVSHKSQCQAGTSSLGQPRYILKTTQASTTVLDC